MKKVIIDVREKDEFAADSIENSINAPLSTFGTEGPALLKSLAGNRIVLMCRSGKRAGLAAQQSAGFGLDGLELEVYPGGIIAWKQEGFPTRIVKSSHLPIMRQVQLIAGTLVITGAVLSYYSHPAWAALSAFVGGGLSLAGATGFCGMAELLALMPWNKGDTSPRTCAQ